MKHKALRKVGYRNWSRQGPVPCIFVQGICLKDLGFPVGSTCKIEYAQNKIVITAYSEPSEQETAK